MISIVDFGAVGDGKTLCTTSIQGAIDAAAAVGGGSVLVPAGSFLTGAIELRSHITLFLDSGSELVGSSSEDDYPLVESRWEGSTRTVHAPLVGGFGLTDIAIRGTGTINGNGSRFWELFRTKTLAHPRPRLVSFVDCTSVLLEGFTARNSPSWTINPVRCSNVRITGLSVINPPDSPNTDGINPDSCSRVRISDCFVSVGDDCITIKSGTEHEKGHLFAPCEDITITNCILESGHGGVVIGSEMSGGVRNVAISNCIFHGTDRGIRLKSRRGRGGIVEDIRVSNIIMEDVLCPLTMNLYYGCGAWGDTTVSDKAPAPVDTGTPVFRSISLSSITAKGIRLAAAYLYGLPEMPIDAISLSDCRFSLAPGSEDLAQVEMGDGLPDLARAGFFARNVTALKLDNVTISGQNGAAWLMEDCSGSCEGSDLSSGPA